MLMMKIQAIVVLVALFYSFMALAKIFNDDYTILLNKIFPPNRSQYWSIKILKLVIDVTGRILIGALFVIVLYKAGDCFAWVFEDRFAWIFQ